MTKSTQQLADELADALCHEYHGAFHPDTELFKTNLKHDLLKIIPLLELLEVARAVKPSLEGIPDEDLFPEQRALLNALTNLQKKLEL